MINFQISCPLLFSCIDDLVDRALQRELEHVLGDSSSGESDATTLDVGGVIKSAEVLRDLGSIAPESAVLIAVIYAMN